MLAAHVSCLRAQLVLLQNPNNLLFGKSLARELDRLIACRGKPMALVSDNVLRAEGDLFGGQSISVREHALAAEWLST